MPDLCHSSSGKIPSGCSRSFISVTDSWIATLPDKSVFLNSSRTSVPFLTHYPRARLHNCLNPISVSLWPTQPCCRPQGQEHGGGVGVGEGSHIELGTSGAVVRAINPELVSPTCHLGPSKSHLSVLITKGL